MENDNLVKSYKHLIDVMNMKLLQIVIFVLSIVAMTYPQKQTSVHPLPQKQTLAEFNQAQSETNPKYEFVNHCKHDLSNQLKVVPNSRHEKLLESMQKDVVVGYYYPCLMEYSLPAAIESINNLPNQFLLAGGFDTCSAFIGSPNLLLRKNGYPPLLWMTALKSNGEDVGYHIEAYGYNLTFNKRAHLNQATEYWCHSLVTVSYTHLTLPTNREV